MITGLMLAGAPVWDAVVHSFHAMTQLPVFPKPLWWCG
jgi:hypothetical protein